MYDQIGQTTSFLKQALQGLSQRQQAISTNLSNADTPQYRRVEVSFENQLQAKLAGQAPSPVWATHERHFPLVVDAAAFAPVVTEDRSTVLRRDGSNVDVDQEMARLAQNEIGFNAAMQFIGGKFSTLKYVISDGGSGG